MSDTSVARLRLELFVRDLGTSLEFYRDALGFQPTRIEGDYVALRLGGVELGLGLFAGLPQGHPFSEGTARQRGVGVEIVLEVESVGAAFDLVTASGYPIATPLRERPWGLSDFRVVDPDGYYVRVTSR